MKQNSSKIEELKRDLFSNDEATVVSALSACREIGNSQMILPLLTLYAQNHNELVRSTTADMLSNLKVSQTEGPFLEALTDESLRSIRKEVLSFMWNSGIQPVEHLTDLVEMAADSEYEEILEALSLIESMDGPFDENQVEESTYILRQWIAENKGDSRTSLMVEFLKVIQELPIGL
jgi:HEAT repeat protein